MTTQIDTLNTLYQTARAAEEGGRWDDALAAYTSLIERLDAGSELKAEILRRIGNVHFYRGDLDVAAQLYQASCAEAEMRGAIKDVASALNGQAVAYQGLGQLDKAEACYMRALTAAEEVGHSRLAVMIEQNLATIASTQGDSALALLRYQSAMQRYEASNDVQGLAGVLNNVGMLFSDLRQWHRAEAAFDRALMYAQQRHDSEVVGTIQLNRADMFVQ